MRSDEAAHDRKPLEPVTDEETRARRFGEYLAAKLEEGDLQGTLQDEPFLRFVPVSRLSGVIFGC